MLLVLFLLNLLLCFEPLPHVKAQPSSNSSQQLDALLQQYAYKALVNPTTGTIYNATQQLPSNLIGIKVAALRLRSGSLRRKGHKMYNEFSIPKGLIETPYVERLVLVYQNLGNLSTRYYYPLLNYTYLTPILGLIAYDGSNLSATNLQVLHINATHDPIIVKFHDVKSPPKGTMAKCVWFDLNGASNFSNVIKGNTCHASQQGHFSIVVNSNATSPKGGGGVENKSEISNKVWIIIIVIVSVVGGIALVVVLSLLVLWMKKFKQKKRMQKMEKAADVGEPLHMTSVGYTKAPAATVTRTQPTLEHEYET
ncbi:hypothetical protein RIF29_00038 [Crotalaria pallida]|uniref:Uncharacterized protein n=1 Tax=Crotalaria pallida TaxID=3830 RepID=A0AAN9IX31_CROPI